MPADYVMGHSDSELERLVWQGEVLRPWTERLLRAIGLQPGMRVLDLGCGAGDVTMLAAKLVGPAGSVVGIDRSAEPLALAGARASDAGLSWVTFRQAAVEEYTSLAPFDAVIGRYVLFHQEQPAAFLRAAGRHVRPGGVLAFHETATSRSFYSHPEVPLFQQAAEWLRQASLAALPSSDAGSRLIELFAAGGLPDPEILAEVPVGGGPGSPLYRWLADTLRTLLPVLQSLGVPAGEVKVDTLEDRLRSAVTEARAQVEFPPQYLGFARI